METFVAGFALDCEFACFTPRLYSRDLPNDSKFDDLFYSLKIFGLECLFVLYCRRLQSELQIGYLVLLIEISDADPG